MNEIKEYFGKNLKRLRQASGYTQEKLSELIGINQRQLTRIETGRSFPSFTTLDNICNVLSISAKELFDFSLYGEFAKSGTDNFAYYVANKTDSNVIYLKNKTTNSEEISKDSSRIFDETDMFKIAKNLQRPIYVDYFQGNTFIKKVTYNPDGTSSIEIKSKSNEILLNEIIDKLNSIKTSTPKMKFLNLAIKCLEDKSSIEKLQNMLEGMLL